MLSNLGVLREKEMFSILGSRSCVRKEITCALPLTSNNGVFLGIPLILKEQKWRMTSTYKINFTNINIRKLLFEEVQAYVTDYKFWGGDIVSKIITYCI